MMPFEDVHCTCVREQTDEVEVIAALCAAHAPHAEEYDAGLQRALDQELDALVHEACGGKRVARIWKADP